MSDNPFGPGVMPAFSAVLRDIGQTVEHHKLVRIRQKCLAGFGKDNSIPAACYALVVMKRMAEGDSVEYIMGMRMKRFVKLARNEAARYGL